MTQCPNCLANFTGEHECLFTEYAEAVSQSQIALRVLVSALKELINKEKNV